jgi:hypothetical protein
MRFCRLRQTIFIALNLSAFLSVLLLKNTAKSGAERLTKILSAVKEGQQKYCETVYSRSGINHMWILKNSKDLL